MLGIKESILVAGISFSLAFSPIDIPQPSVQATTDLITVNIVETATNAVNNIELPEQEVEEVVPAYSDEDLYWLSRLIFAEAGSNSCSDELQWAVASVVINRMWSSVYPNSIKDVIFDTHWGVQYGCTTSGMIYREPNDRAIANAIYILENGPTLPYYVLSQGAYSAWDNIYCNIQGVIFSSYFG